MELPEERIYTFPQGLIGFPQVRRFAMVDNPGGGPFQWLQAVDFPELAFVITDPLVFFPDYTVPLKVEVLQSIGMEDVKQAVVVVILVVPHNPRLITANLQGPIIINPAGRIARQLVLDVAEYSTRHFIFEQEKMEDLTAQEEEISC
jgi:flagellar assembly factor FliW